MKVNRLTAMLMLSGSAFFANASSYEIQELPTQQLSYNQFAGSIDDTGLMLTLLDQPFNPPIDLSLIDLDALPLTDPDAAAQGNFNATDLAIIASQLVQASTNNSPFGQKLASEVAYQTDGTDFSYVYGLDQQTETTNGYTFSQTMSLGDSVNGTHIVGTMAGPYSVVEYVNENDEDVTYNVNSYNNRAFVQVGDQVTQLLAPSLLGGGISEANAINDNLMVVGRSSIAISETIEQQLANCEDDEVRGDFPLEVCYFGIINNISSNGTTNLFEVNNTRRATTWQLDNAGNVIERTVYGLSFEPDADSTTVFSNEALDINNSNVAVGSTIVPLNDSFSTAAASFADGVTTRLIADDDLLPNQAFGVNDDGYVVGTRQEIINGAFRSKMFIYNLNTDEIDFPDDFFQTANIYPRAINNNNIVVGDGEVTAPTSGIRERNGFVYDIDADTFTNINSLVACDSAYQIIAANDINDNNEIIAEAIVQKPLRDYSGEIVIDDDGEQVIRDFIVAIKLTPTGNAASNCEPDEEEVVATERQGAGLGYITLFILCVISVTRRFRIVK